jgi:hypothetical protein
MGFVAADISILAANYKHFPAVPRDMVIDGARLGAAPRCCLAGRTQFPVASQRPLCDSLLMSQRD